MRILQNLNVNWMAKRKMFYLFSLSIILLGVISMLFRGLAFGTDFKGGTELEIQFDKQITIEELRNDLSNIGLGDLEVKMFGGNQTVLIRTDLQHLPDNIYPKVQATLESAIAKAAPGVSYKINEKTLTSIVFEFANTDTTNILVDKIWKSGYQAGKVSEEASNKQMIVRLGIGDWIKDNLRTKMPNHSFDIRRAEVIGPKVGNELKLSAITAIFFSLIGILIYLGFRYKFIFAAGAVLALFHDVLITLGLFALLKDVIPGLNLEINLTIIAAFLTLIGYSVMDTVIVFDRVRETIRVHKNETLFNLMNESINKTMSRTILSGGTTLMACIVLLFFGGEVLRSFAFTLTFGIITGTYSSIFVASAIVLDYVEKTKKKIEF